MIRPRSKPRTGEPTPAEKKAMRDRVYTESGGRCELRRDPHCISGVLPKDGITPWDHWHLVHLRSKRVHGWARENLCGGCWICHLINMHSYGPSGVKPCPPKPASHESH